MINVITKFKADFLTFPAGERHARVKFLHNEMLSSHEYYDDQDKEIRVEMNFEGSQDIVDLLLLCDAIKGYYKHNADKYKLVLFSPYLPFARQDRDAVQGDSFALNVFFEVLRLCGVKRLVTYDCHSSVTTTLASVYGIDLSNTEQDVLLGPLIKKIHNTASQKKYTLISPDVGANKKTEKVFEYCEKYNILPNCNLIQAFKHRDPKSGNLSTPSIDVDKLNDVCIIVDDICDGGGTFIQLGKHILDHKPNIELYLVTTHGIYSKGMDELTKYFKGIYCANRVGNYK